MSTKSPPISFFWAFNRISWFSSVNGPDSRFHLGNVEVLNVRHFDFDFDFDFPFSALPVFGQSSEKTSRWTLRVVIDWWPPLPIPLSLSSNTTHNMSPAVCQLYHLVSSRWCSWLKENSTCLPAFREEYWQHVHPNPEHTAGNLSLLRFSCFFLLCLTVAVWDVALKSYVISFL